MLVVKVPGRGTGSEVSQKSLSSLLLEMLEEGCGGLAVLLLSNNGRHSGKLTTRTSPSVWLSYFLCAHFAVEGDHSFL